MASSDRGTFVYANPPEIHWGAGCAEERLNAVLERLDRGRRDTPGDPLFAVVAWRAAGGAAARRY